MEESSLKVKRMCPRERSKPIIKELFRILMYKLMRRKTEACV